MKDIIRACISKAMTDAVTITTRPTGEWGHSQEFYYQARLLESFGASKSMACMAETSYSHFTDGSISFPITSNPRGGYCDLVVYSREHCTKYSQLSHSVLCAIELKYSGGYNPHTMRADFDRLCNWVTVSHAKGYYVHIYVKSSTPIIRNIDSYMTSDRCHVIVEHHKLEGNNFGISIVELSMIV